jgi:hypothetical protein
MKTFVIKLETHDDAISTRDKMAWSKAARILLVWPEHGSILTNRLDLVQLQRFSQQLGAQLALVTRSIAVEDQAREMGIPVFSSVSRAQQLPWRRGRQRRKSPARRQPGKQVNIRALKVQVEKAMRIPPENAWVRALAFLAGVAAVILLVSLFLPAAKIVMRLPEQDQSLSLAVWTNPTITSPTISGGVPAHLLAVTIEGQDEIASTGSLTIPSQRAAGMVRFTNLTGELVNVPAGSIVTTLSVIPVRFELAKTVEVPAGPGQAMDAEVKAILPGQTGNVAAGEIQAIEGQLGLSLSVENFEQMQGGSDYTVPMPTESDYQTLHQRLRQTLQENSLHKLQGMTGNNQHLILASLQEKKVISESRDPQEGSPADRLKLSLQSEFSAWYFTDEDLQVVARNTLDANLSPDQVAVPDTLFISSLNEPILSGESARWDIHAVRRIRPEWSSDAVAALVMGRKPAEASRLLNERFGLQNPAEVALVPSWWPFLPFLSFRIQVEAQ